MKQVRKSSRVLVPEDDEQFLRFWAVYPHHISKLDARKAWAALNPSAALVDRMVEALTWQTTLWARQGYGTPYPASWLRDERWTDEPPRQVGRLSAKTQGTLEAAASILKGDV